MLGIQADIQFQFDCPRIGRCCEGYTFPPRIHWTYIYLGGCQKAGWRESVLFVQSRVGVGGPLPLLEVKHVTTGPESFVLQTRFDEETSDVIHAPASQWERF